MLELLLQLFCTRKRAKNYMARCYKNAFLKKHAIFIWLMLCGFTLRILFIEHQGLSNDELSAWFRTRYVDWDSFWNLGVKTGQWLKKGQIPIDRTLGKELTLLAWALEDADPELSVAAVHNWLGLVPEERWWLYTMTVATTGQAMQKGIGWRKALRFALADNPFIKGEGSSPKQRREMLAHTQLTLNFD